MAYLKRPGIKAFIHVFVESSQLEEVCREMGKLPEVIDVYEVTGEFDVIAVVAATNINEFRRSLRDKILKIPGVKSTVTSIVLHTHKRDGVELEE
ncbi:MAG: Lrp/AsnC ligand binding domain-containing protein [Nitrososphaerota archaeon]